MWGGGARRSILPRVALSHQRCVHSTIYVQANLEAEERSEGKHGVASCRILVALRDQGCTVRSYAYEKYVRTYVRTYVREGAYAALDAFYLKRKNGHNSRSCAWIGTIPLALESV
jgi:hypothetical protein